MPSDKQAFLKLARARFAQAETADHAQRTRELEDLRFYAGDQWDPETLAARKGQPAQDGLPPTSPRPSFVINKQRAPIKQVTNEERQAELGIELVAADDFGELEPIIDDTEIALREGLIRKIQRDSDAQDARSWAFSRAVIAGRGYYAVMTRFLPGKTRDQEIYVHRFYNQACVSLDPTHEQPDGSDADWEFSGVDNMPFDEYEATYGERNGKPNRVIAAKSAAEWRAVGDDAPDWFTTDGEVRSCRVVDYFYTERTPRKLATLKDGSVEWLEDVTDETQIAEDNNGKRQIDIVIEKRIKWAKIDGCNDDVLDETDWPGPDMPIIKILGEELHPYDKERRAEGLIRPSRDSQQGFNAMVSKGVEVIALNPVPAPQMAEGQQEGYEKWWQAATTRTMPYLLYRTRDLEGNPAGPPTRAAFDLPYQPIFASLQMFDQALQSTTGVPDPQLGNVDPSLKSGKVVEALQKRSQHGTSNFLSNHQRSVQYEGQVINNLLYPIYGKPGRIARIMTPEGKSQTIRLGAPVAMPPSPMPPAPLGAPQMPGSPPPAAGGAPGGLLPPSGPPPPPMPPPKVYQLTKDAHFNVIVKVTQSFNSKREQEAQMIAALLEANPMYMTWFGDTFFENQDGPGHHDMAQRAKVMLDPKIQMMLSQQPGQQMPPQAMAMISQLQQQLQAAHGVIQQAQQEIQAKTTEWAARAQIAKDDREFNAPIDLEQVRMNNETKIAVAELGAKVERLQLFMEERSRLGDQQHEMAMGAAQAHHDLKKLRITKTLQWDAQGNVTGATEDHEEVPTPTLS